ncbi:uncharacterized protein N0V89_012352, partial [Didymosphaeria variabile]
STLNTAISLPLPITHQSPAYKAIPFLRTNIYSSPKPQSSSQSRATMPSKERETTDALIRAFNTQDVDTIIALRTPDCKRVFLPSSLNFPPQSNEAYRQNLTGMKSVFTSFELTIHDIVEGVSQDEQGIERRKIVVFTSARGDTPVGEYRNEYVWKMGFEEGGQRVSEWVEYVDAGMAKDFAQKLAAEVKKKAGERASS